MLSSEAESGGDDLVRLPELIARYIPLSRATIWRLVRDRDRTGFPAPIRFGKRTIGWRRSEIIQYLAARQGQ
jgi:predicted DNA-binding transcriptional regulator AlpA